MREEDVEAVRRGYEAWNRGDFDAVGWYAYRNRADALAGVKN